MKKVIDCKAIADNFNNHLKQEVINLKSRGIFPKLAIILVGNNPSSLFYIKSKQIKANELGIEHQLFHFEENVSQEEVISLINKLNQDIYFHGILIQLPLPLHLNKLKILESIDYKKDVDGLHPLNVGMMSFNLKKAIIPCTARAVWQIISSLNLDMVGKHGVVVGKSNLVGLPVAQILLSNQLTVSVCHKLTKNLEEITSQADVLVVATGAYNLINKEHVKQGAIVIDVGISKVNNEIVGDVNFESVYDKVSYITPVPKGVGLLTVANLMYNIVQLAKN